MKTDNPLIICTSNSNLRMLVNKKHRNACQCNPLEADILCYSPVKCKVHDSVSNFYKAIVSRIHEIEVKVPLCPPGSDKKLFEEWRQFVSNAIQTHSD